jgi:hypothetical protein
MKMHLAAAALTAFAVVCLAPRAEAGCVIAPDGKSIDVVTDNGASEETNCAVKCQVDTKIGLVQLSCGGNTPPLAKAHSLCGYDKPEPWYRKVVSSEDSCKGAAASAAPVAAPPPPVKPGTFICQIAPDGHSFDAVIANPYKVEASCQVNCQISTTLAGTTEQSSCSRNVAPGVGEVVLCTHSFDQGRLVKVIGGSGNCTDPTPKPSSADADDADDDAEMNKALKDPDKMQEYVRKRAARAPPPPPSAAKAAKTESAEEMEKIMDDPDKMDAYMRKQMDPATQKLFDKVNKP